MPSPLPARASWFLALLVPTSLLTLWACSRVADDLIFDSSGEIVISEELGIRISDAAEWGQSPRYLANGSVELFDPSVTVEVDGLGTREMGIYSQFEDERHGGGAYTSVTDVATGESRNVYYMPDYSAIAFGDEVGGVMVMANGDGSYEVVTMVDRSPKSDVYEHAEDGIAALELVEEYNDFSSLSDFMLITMYAQGQGEGPEFRTPIACSTGGFARTPAVCTLFKEFCDCTVCSVLGETGGSCSLCPNL